MGEFLQLFMEKYPNCLYSNETLALDRNPDHSVISYFSTAHLAAAIALNEPEWPWINADEIMQRYNELPPPVA